MCLTRDYFLHSNLLAIVLTNKSLFAVRGEINLCSTNTYRDEGIDSFDYGHILVVSHSMSASIFEVYLDSQP